VVGARRRHHALRATDNAMGTPKNAEELLHLAVNAELISERQFQEIWAAVGAHNAALEEVKKHLVRAGLLTNYQLERLAKGERTGYFYGPYKVLYYVGAGTFARVFRAAHRQSGEIVALKVLRKHFSEHPEQVAQFVREGKLGSTLRHPNIVPTYEVVSQGKIHFIVMEFVEGYNLRDLVKIRKKLDPLLATRLMIDIVKGLNYALENGLTHRDLKLNNVLVTSSSQAKVVDFGLATIQDEEAEVAEEMPNVRTIDYAVLERATGVRKDDKRSDIYFAGCIFYQMLSGETPLEETDRAQRMSKQRFLDVIPIHERDPELSHWVCSVVNKAMMLEPMRRYQSPAAMLADLAIVERQLIEGGDSETAEADMAALGTYVEVKQPTVLVVESDPKWQDIFRGGFKRVNYKVLVTADPKRAVDRVRQDITAVQCLVFCAQGLGEAALTGFNELARDKKTTSMPALLLLDEPQKDWKEQAAAAEHRMVLTMPITMKELRNALAALLSFPPVKPDGNKKEET
jgi:serine/threonine-protein kinase